MPTRVYPINWREEFEQLAPYLNGRGGIVRICFPSRRCALPSFLETLKWEYESKTGNSAWCSIRIDAEVYSVRFLVLLRQKLNGDPAHAVISGKNSQCVNLSKAASLLGFCNL